MKFKPFIDILITYILFFVSIKIATSVNPSFLTLMIISLFLALLLHRLGLFIHAGAHTEFHENLKKNDLLYKFYLGWFFGTNLQAYRKIHFAHHKYHGTEFYDPEDTYSNGLSLKKILMLILRKNNLIISRQENLKHQIINLRYVSIISQASILFFCIFHLGFFKGAIFYGGAVFLGLPILTHIRNCLEHTPSTNEAVVSRNFYGGIIAFFLGAAGFRLHEEHHKNPKIKYWDLDNFAPKVKDSYIKTFCKVLL